MSHKKTLRKQNTLIREVSYSGVGIHTGVDVTMILCPAPVGTGIVFKRTDLPDAPIIPATVENLHSTSRSTNIGDGDIVINTVEHLLAALKAYNIDNLTIKISGGEVPVSNGSSEVFVDLIEDAGVEEQDSDVAIVSIDTPLFFSDGDIHLVALPSDEYRVSYTLHHPETAAIGTQFLSVVVDADTFKNEIAPCRTFAKHEDIEFLMERGLIKGGSLDNAVVVKGDTVLNEEGLKFPDEMVRHKILDLIGDLSLVGVPFCAHIIAIKSGHTSNASFAKILLKKLT